MADLSNVKGKDYVRARAVHDTWLAVSDWLCRSRKHSCEELMVQGRPEKGDAEVAQ